MFSELSPAVELNAVFKRCHNYIYVNHPVPEVVSQFEIMDIHFRIDSPAAGL